MCVCVCEGSGGDAVCSEGGEVGVGVGGFSLLLGESTDAGRWLTYCPELTRAQNNYSKVQRSQVGGRTSPPSTERRKQREMNNNEQEPCRIFLFISFIYDAENKHNFTLLLWCKTAQQLQ